MVEPSFFLQQQVTGRNVRAKTVKWSNGVAKQTMLPMTTRSRTALNAKHSTQSSRLSFVRPSVSQPSVQECFAPGSEESRICCECDWINLTDTPYYRHPPVPDTGYPGVLEGKVCKRCYLLFTPLCSLPGNCVGKLVDNRIPPSAPFLPEAERRSGRVVLARSSNQVSITPPGTALSRCSLLLLLLRIFKTIAGWSHSLLGKKEK